MAKIGLKNFRYSILTEADDGTPSYNGAVKPAHAISCSVEISNNNAQLFGDDALIESDTGFSSGTVTIGIDKFDKTTQAALLGHTATENEIISNVNDEVPFVGLGRIITEMIGGAYKYTVKFLYKVKFSEPNDSDQTKGENVEFNTVELQGTVAALKNGNWKAEQTFDTEKAAVSYLEGLMAAGE